MISYFGSNPIHRRTYMHIIKMVVGAFVALVLACVALGILGGALGLTFGVFGALWELLFGLLGALWSILGSIFSLLWKIICSPVIIALIVLYIVVKIHSRSAA
jgi:peptidoglycan/LPS O-acetylase OafA/YrhL